MDSFIWTQDKTINLVEQWEAEPALWDKNHSGYKSSTAKFDSLKRIADELGTTPNVIQSKLSSIKSQFSCEQKKLKTTTTGSGTAGKPRTTWFLFDYLTFLVNSTRIADTISSSSVSSDTIVEEVHVDVMQGVPDEFRDEEWENHNLMGERAPERTNARPNKRRAENVSLTNAVVALSKSLTEPEKPEVVPAEDECDIFGKLIAKRMRSIKNDVIRMLAEQEILNVVTMKVCEDQGVTVTHGVRSD